MASKEVDFTSPPVSEVVFGFLFEKPTRLLTSHFGAFWSRIRSNFPATEDQPPLFNIGDAHDPSLPLSRVWFISGDGRRLIQLQHDRLYYNWRRLDGDTVPYPEYANLFLEFSKVMELFSSFLREESLTDEVHAGQFELSYINMLERPRLWDKDTPLGNVLVDHTWQGEGSRFLPKPKDYAWMSVFDMPGEAGQLIVEAKSGRKTAFPEEQVIQLTLTAKSMVLASSSNTLLKGGTWFETAHKQIVNGFTDITDPVVQKTDWGRK